MSDSNPDLFKAEDKEYSLSISGLDVGFVNGAKKRLLIGDLDLNLMEGELLSVMGPNGAGKSTLLRCLSGLMKPLSGKISYFGDPELIERPKERSKVLSIADTYLPDVGMMRVDQLVRLGRFPHQSIVGWDSSYGADKVAEVMKLLDLEGFAGVEVGKLSDGEKQRVMIARALVQDPKIIVLDEPTAFLDVNHSVRLMMKLREVAKNRGVTTIFSTHDLHLALRFSDRACLIAKNRKAIMGSPEDLMLDGTISSVFALQGIELDLSSANFEPSWSKNRGILKGDPTASLWVENALKKNDLATINWNEVEITSTHLNSGEYEYLVKVSGDSTLCSSIGQILKLFDG